MMNAERTKFNRITCRCCGAMAPELNWQERAPQQGAPEASAWSGRIIEIDYETHRAIVRYEGNHPTIGDDLSATPTSAPVQAEVPKE